ncbi:MAG: SUF system NifU family Fe-S cluster assembly protein [Dehalococcoidia bacterium]|nr:SUF system NifU family Fe-S cluster assembly protein [Dehalococcoidia bacterium]
MSDLEELYREILLEHYRSPRNAGHVPGATHSADGANPLCGDEVHLELTLDGDGRVADIAFSGHGCSISQASSSLMTEYVKGRAAEAALAAVGDFQRMMIEGDPPPAADFGDLEALAGVAKFPVRVKCASLGWKTLEQALADKRGAPAAVTTDERSL